MAYEALYDLTPLLLFPTYASSSVAQAFFLSPWSPLSLFLPLGLAFALPSAWNTRLHLGVNNFVLMFMYQLLRKPPTAIGILSHSCIFLFITSLLSESVLFALFIYSWNYDLVLLLDHKHHKDEGLICLCYCFIPSTYNRASRYPGDLLNRSLLYARHCTRVCRFSNERKAKSVPFLCDHSVPSHEEHVIEIASSWTTS